MGSSVLTHLFFYSFFIKPSKSVVSFLILFFSTKYQKLIDKFIREENNIKTTVKNKSTKDPLDGYHEFIFYLLITKFRLILFISAFIFCNLLHSSLNLYAVALFSYFILMWIKNKNLNDKYIFVNLFYT